MSQKDKYLNIVLSLFNCISDDLKKQTLKLLIIVLISAVLEMLALAAIVPFLSMLINGNGGVSNDYLFKVLTLLLGIAVDDYKVQMLYAALLTLSLVSVSTLLKILSILVINKHSERIREYLTIALYSSSLYQPYHTFSAKHTSDFVKNMISEVDLVINFFLRPVIQMITYGALLLLIVGLLFVTNPAVAFLVVLITAGFYVVVYLLIRNKMRVWGQTIEESNTERYRHASDTFDGVKYIKMSSIEGYLIKSMQAYATKFSNAQASFGTASLLPGVIIEFILFISILSIGVFTLVSEDSFIEMIPELGLFGLAALKIKPALQVVYQGVASVKHHTPMVKNITSELAKLRRDLISKKSLVSSKYYQIDARVVIMDHCYFKYPSSTKNVLINVNLDIKSGDRVGIIGQSGSGKSTLLNLLVGLLAPSEGECKIFNVSSSSERDTSGIIGYVSQTTFFENLTWADSIRYGNKLIEDDSARINEVCEIVCLREHLNDFGVKLNTTRVGPNASGLSGGQKQRLAIARAIYNRPKVLVLDEATSALDIELEETVMQNIVKYLPNSTIILVTHRKEILSLCDKLYEVRAGYVNAVLKSMV